MVESTDNAKRQPGHIDTPASNASHGPDNGAKRKKPSDEVNASNIKETLESILVAFILAFIFRAFIVEAFVIPTGSMAPTLMGAHYRFACPDCGYHFDVNYSAPPGPRRDEDNIPPEALINFPVYCPNCGLRQADTNQKVRPVAYGDRILVLKYLYMGLPTSASAYHPFGQPQRWDVVVFKSPDDKVEKPYYTVNFIKRLIGKPGETIMVLDGDIYAKAPGESEFKIQTKPPAAQDALWRIVYDNDYHPAGLAPRSIPWQQPWKCDTDSPTDGWKEAQRRFVFTGDQMATLRFSHQANAEKHDLTDWLAYDQTAPPREQQNNTVSDLKMDMIYTRQAGDGPLQLVLSKYDTTFTAEIKNDEARLLMRTGSSPEKVLRTVPIKPTGTDSVRLEFMNVDYQVTLRVNGRDLIQTTADEYHPDIASIREMLTAAAQRGQKPALPQVLIRAAKQTCVVEHLKLWRDVYYTPRDGNGQDIVWGNPDGNPPGVTLGNDEYFVMGDNSLMSFDARFWRQPIDLQKNEDLTVSAGRVPGRFLLGKAFFVYWPAGFRVPGVGISLVPNFGDMRFVH